ncbi:hypothetical protein BB561_000508 [Smittium simulii]|uniref:ER membrane protein complex subunit 3 n=1 Tax=Smittium simulii TaxID=133385 RepID=A0A2T9YYY4_9FUNG|nr:hypothetical protein BB561_000508 [Smittium simulii]
MNSLTNVGFNFPFYSVDQNMFLDPEIRNWVLFPIMLVMILVGIVRHQISQLFVATPKPITLKAHRQQNMLTRAGLLIQNSKYIPKSSFEGRLIDYTKAFESGDYLEFPENKDAGAPNPMSDPKVLDSMMDGLKTQMLGIIPQTLIMGWIQFFFSGFILTKLPFPIGNRFKSMLQDGIKTPNMDVRWVSSISFYFLNLFGLNGVFSLFLGGNNSASGVDDLQAMSNMGAFGNQNQNNAAAAAIQDYQKLFLEAKENLELVHYRFDLDQIDQTVLKMYNKNPSSSSSAIKNKNKA